MDIRIAENIREQRKKLGMRQEQLAELLGVSIGAVSKWERGAALPELSYIVSLADLFGMSVDALLGYELHRSSLSSLLNRLTQYRKEKRIDEGMELAEYAVERFPNHFMVVYRCGRLYALCATERQDPAAARRAVELLQRSIELYHENTDSAISQVEIFYDIALCHLALQEPEKALEVLRRNNPHGLYNADIGMICANYLRSADQAFPPLAKALRSLMTTLARTILGYAAAYHQTGQYEKVLHAWRWLSNLMMDLNADENIATYFDRYVAVVSVYCAQMSEKLGRREDARMYLERSFALAQKFDKAPEYTMGGIKFDECAKDESIYDIFGPTAMLGAEAVLRQAAETEPVLVEIWNTLKQEKGDIQ